MGKPLHGARLLVRLPGEKTEIVVPMKEGDTYQTLTDRLIRMLRPAPAPQPSPLDNQCPFVTPNGDDDEYLCCGEDVGHAHPHRTVYGTGGDRCWYLRDGAAPPSAPPEGHSGGEVP